MAFPVSYSATDPTKDFKGLFVFHVDPKTIKFKGKGRINHINSKNGSLDAFKSKRDV